MKHHITLLLVLGLILATSVTSGYGKRRPPSYAQVVRQVSRMVYNSHAQRLAAAKKLRILNVMWEDTGRWKGSSVGPNISDVTIEVHVPTGRGGTKRVLMPVIRYPNFTDKTADVKLDKLFIRVGNEKGQPLETVSLKHFLKNPARYMSFPKKGKIKGNSLLAPRDSHLLVSAQAAFLPIPSRSKAKFYPVIFNYQSRRKHPAVLTLLVTRQGTSMTVIDNSRDTVGGRSWGQRLFFNKDGKRAPLMAERLSDVMKKGSTQNGEDAGSLGKDSNLLMMIQVPLKVKQRRRFFSYLTMEGAPKMAMKRSVRTRRGGSSNLEMAVLGHGKTEGPYTELDDLTIERDPRFPIRVTVQYYLATSNGVITKADVRGIHNKIAATYEKGDYVGSLVVPESRKKRPTEWTGISKAPSHLSIWDFAGLVQWYKDHGYLSHGHRISPRRRPAIGIR